MAYSQAYMYTYVCSRKVRYVPVNLDCLPWLIRLRMTEVLNDETILGQKL